jgi:muramidase (phage lysozyme)
MTNANPNVNRFLALIRFTEGTDRYPDPYRVMFGGGTFSDMSRHPNIVVNKGGYASTAAGAYQFLKRTYDSLGMKGMLPAEQDRGAVQLIKRRGAYDDVVAGRWEAAIAKCSKEWASFPGSPYGQPTKGMAACLAFLAKTGATAPASTADSADGEVKKKEGA